MVDIPRRILLGVTGGIAAYKSPDVVRRLRERGAEVQVVMTPSAREFVTPLTFQAVSGREVRESLWDAEAEAAMGHIELARWAEAVLIAPATAEFLARLTHGRADDLLATLCLATTAPVFVAPAMNRAMWANPATQANVRTLLQRGITVLGPARGEQACGEVGEGRMLEPAEIAERLMQHLTCEPVLAGSRVVVSAGPTRERIDPVRYLTNRSSGKMGYALAQAAREAGADVVLVSGPVALAPPPGVRVVSVESAAEMRLAVLEAVAGADVYIGAAAVADYTPGVVHPQKLKKVADTLTLELVRAPDILAEVAALRPRPFVVGFAAETEQLEAHARVKLERKALDLIAANLVGDESGFDRDDNALLLLWPGGQLALEQDSKLALARQLVRQIALLRSPEQRLARRESQGSARA
ncbi:MAG: bifunctional phosphopantothenoylcysteine decarboxylase/phosphopantothenate--cysteine ligase CoaBC [Steroidobacteraceae bacterium]